MDNRQIFTSEKKHLKGGRREKIQIFCYGKRKQNFAHEVNEKLPNFEVQKGDKLLLRPLISINQKAKRSETAMTESLAWCGHLKVVTLYTLHPHKQSF